MDDTAKAEGWPTATDSAEDAAEPALSARNHGPVPSGPLPLEDAEMAAMYQEHSRPIFYLALRLLGDPTQAEDATHDVFLKAYRKIDQFRGDSALRTWLYRITINHCRNLMQAWNQRNMVTNVDDAVWSTAPSPTDNPLRVLETKELGQRIQATLERLPDEYRLLLLLVADEKMSYDEVGSLTGQSADSVRGKLHRARKAFAAQFRSHANPNGKG